ncbi:MAG: PAS domain S-box protein [Sphingomonadales bacterium]|nr:PAS domain S-box protein [Sphingomonadales bacterium]
MKLSNKQPEFLINNLGRILILGIGFAAIGMVSLFAIIDRDVEVVDSAWQELNIMRSEQQAELVRLQSALGYNGVIHHYKNYILRQDPDLLTTLYSKLGAAEEALTELNALSTTADEKRSLGAIEHTLSLYLSAANSVTMHNLEGKSVKEVDEILRVDDTAAIAGISLLSQLWAKDGSGNNEKTEILQAFIAKIGYGGMIHNFKNFVIRQDQEYSVNGIRQLEEAKELLNQYARLSLSEQERTSINVIGGMLSSYEHAFIGVETLSNNQISITDIDKTVRVNDQPSILALDSLQRAIHTQLIIKISGVSSSIYGAKKASELGFIIAIISLSILMFVSIYITREWRKSRNASKEFARQLIASNTTREAILDTAAMGIVTINRKGIVETFNSAAEIMFGHTAAEMIGKHSNLLMDKEDGEKNVNYLRSYMKTGVNKIMGKNRAVNARRKSGEIFPMDLTLTEMKIEGEVKFTAMCRDISENKKIENQLFQAQKMQAVGQLTGGLAHDFNNILAVVIGNIELLRHDLSKQKENASERTLELASEISLAAKQGAELTKSLLAFSSRQPLKPECVSINGALNVMSPLIKRTIGETIETIGIGTPAVECWGAECDLAQLESAIMNIVINAKHAINGKGTITFQCSNISFSETVSTNHSDINAGDYVMLAITDDGCGMNSEVLKLACEPFFTSKSLADHGSGLGLSMVYGFTKQSGGGLDIYSEEGVGTSVKLYLPRSFEEAAAHTDQGNNVPRLNLANKTILLVEDDPAVRKTATHILEREGVNVIEAANGVEAQQKFREHGGVDLVLTDLIMPGGVSGKDLADSLIKTNPDVKIIFMSGYTSNSLGSLQEDIALISKPFSPVQLIDEINKALINK